MFYKSYSTLPMGELKFGSSKLLNLNNLISLGKNITMYAKM